MPAVPGLRSPYSRVGRIVHFGRMLDKIRLEAAGRLPEEYRANLGEAKWPVFDARCCRFLGVRYADIVARVKEGLGDAEVLAWAHAHGTPRDDGECDDWNHFMLKIGWRDGRTAALRQRILECGLGDKPIQTAFDLIDFDEGRDPVAARAWELRPTLGIVIMGVAGSGKTTIGVELARELGWAFKDADEFHPPANIAKMSAGIPLDDEDRGPWLLAIREYLARAFSDGRSVVVTCSGLKERYRRVVVLDPDKVKLVYLKGDFDLILQRLGRREGHFMKDTMLRSQFEALEPPADALTIDVNQTPAAIVSRIRQEFRL